MRSVRPRKKSRSIDSSTARHELPVDPRPKRYLDEGDARYIDITVRCKDMVTDVSHECRVTRKRLLIEGEMSFFASFFRFSPAETLCEIHMEECCHKQFLDYLTNMTVVGGGKLQSLAVMFGLATLSERLRPFKCANCNTWIDPVAPSEECVFRRVQLNERCCECGEFCCKHVHRLPWHVRVRCSAD